MNVTAYVSSTEAQSSLVKINVFVIVKSLCFCINSSSCWNTVDGKTDPSTEGSHADSAGIEPTKDRVTQLCPDEAQADGHFVPKRGFLKVPSLCEPCHCIPAFLTSGLSY